MNDDNKVIVNHKFEADGLYGVIGYVGFGFLTVACAYGSSFAPTDPWVWATLMLWPFFVGYWIMGYVLAGIGVIILLILAVYLVAAISTWRGRFRRNAARRKRLAEKGF